MNINCGSAVTDTCVGATVPYTDAGFQKFVGEGVTSATFMINITFQIMSSGLSDNMIMGLNAARCAIVSGGNTVWYFIASAWWALSWIGQEVLVEDLLDQGYPYICTCLEDVNTFAAYFGATSTTASAFSSCSEAAS